MKKILQIEMDNNIFYATLTKSKLSKRIYFTITKDKDKAFPFNESKNYITKDGEDFFQLMEENPTETVNKLFLTESERNKVNDNIKVQWLFI